MTVLKCRFYYSGIMSRTDEMIATEKVVYYLSGVPKRRGHTKRHATQGNKGKHQVGQRQREQGGKCKSSALLWLPREGMNGAGQKGLEVNNLRYRDCL